MFQSMNFKSNRTFPKSLTRGFIGATYNRMSDWDNEVMAPINLDLATQQREVIKKCRYLAKNNDIVRSYLGMAVKNIIGKMGIQLQSQMKSANGDLDESFNDELEWAWYEWGKKSNGMLTVDGQMGHTDFDGLILRTLLIDGEVFIMIHRDAKNPYRNLL